MEITEIPHVSNSSSPSSKRKTLHNPKPKPISRKKLKKKVCIVDSAPTSSSASPIKRYKNRRKSEKEDIFIEEENELERRPKKRRQKKKIQEPECMDLCLINRASDDISNVDNNVWEAISELVLWKNVAKSTLWFGSGSMVFLSSCFSRDSSFSIISTASHLGILVLGMNFFRDSLPGRLHKSREVKLQLTEQDFLRAARLILPITNTVLAKCQILLSGDPLMTLKVAPVLLLTAKYGHLITAWRLLATGFFLSFTLPKLYASHSVKIHQRAEEAKNYIKKAWKSCPRKKLVATSAILLFWNMFSAKTRIFAAFMSVAILRHRKQQCERGP